MDSLRRLFFPLFTPGHVWRSGRYRSFIVNIDRFSFWFTIINNSLVVGNHSRFRLLQWPLSLHYSLMAFWVGCAVLQQCWYRTSPDSYFKHRHVMQLTNRLSRLLASAAFLRHLRLMTKPLPHTASSPVLLMATARPHQPRAWAALAFAMLCTGALHPTMHSVNPPMPMLGQFMMQVGYLSVLLAQQASTAVALLDASPFKSQYTGFCEFLNSLLYIAASLCGHVADQRLLGNECSSNATWLLVLFTDLYFGLVVPLYVSYWLERYFWLVMQDDAVPVADVPQGASVAFRVLKANILGLTHVLLHVVLLVYAAALTWVVVMALHPLMARLLLRGGAKGKPADAVAL